MMKLIPTFHRDEILKEQLKLVTRSHLASTAGVLIICAGLTYIVYTETNHSSVFIWYALCIMTYIARAYYQSYIADYDSDNPRRVAVGEVLMVLASNIIICYLPITYMTAAYSPTVVLSIAIAIGGLSAGSVSMQGPCLPIFYGYTLPKMIVATVLLFLPGEKAYYLMGLGMTLFLFLSVMFAHRIEQSIVDSIKLRFENKDLIKQLRTALVETDQANNAKSVFLASASHDLRQPMHALNLMVEILGNTKLDTQQIKLQEKMTAAIDSTRGMLDSFLDISKLEAGVITAKPKPFYIQTVFDKLESEIFPTSTNKQLDFRVRQSYAIANSDILIVELIIRNLLSNAIRYTTEGGILLSCRKRSPNKLLIQVWDTGIGIPETKKEEIFVPFQQLDNLERDSQKGFGLGLAITQGLAETIGTIISVNSIEGRGSVFSFEVPDSNNQIIETNMETERPFSMAGKSILIIEDNAKVRTSIHELVTSWDCQCISTDSAVEAINQLNNDAAIDIMLVDYRLRDGLTGWNAIIDIRKYLEQEIPAIIITGDTSAERIKEASETDAILMYKPIVIDELKKNMMALLNKS